MIKAPFPHMVLNAEAIPGPFKMWNTYNVPYAESVEHMLGWAAYVAQTSPWGKLETLIINCHGGPARLLIGAEITRNDTPTFAVLKDQEGRPRVTRIWIVACSAGYIGSGPAGDGNLFSCEIAKASGAYVTVPTGGQRGERKVPYGYIDDWEGTVLTYGPRGNVVATRNY
jgi:hypothetical protein